MDYGGILRRAWEITWRHRVLWLFGFLAGLSSDSRFVSNTIRDNLTERQSIWLARFVFSPAFLGVILLLTVIGLGIEILSGMGRAGMISQVNRLEEDGSRPTVPSGWRASTKYMWRIFGITVLLSLPVLLTILVGLLPIIIPWLRGLVGASMTGLNWRRIGAQLLACFPPLCCAGVLLSIFLGMIRQLAERVCVLENRSVWTSITGAFALLRDRTGPVLAVWLILAGITIGLVIVLAIPVCMLMIFASLPLRMMEAYSTARIAADVFVAILVWLVLAAIGSVVRPFFSSCWTIAYRGLREPVGVEILPAPAPTTEVQKGNQ